MAALDFPNSPTPGQLYPSPAVSGVTQYEWSNVYGVWNAVANFVRLNNQLAFNGYSWPLTDGAAGQQLETDGLGNLYWDAASNPELLSLSLQQAFDNVSASFTLIRSDDLSVYTPIPGSNLIIILGGVGQTPGSAYTIATSTITFTNPPPAGTTFAGFTAIQG